MDWTKYTFTLDDKIVSQAYKTFKKLWDDGLVYRGERLVNYCTFHRTGFADVEVEHVMVCGVPDFVVLLQSVRVLVTRVEHEAMAGSVAQVN